MYDALKNRDYPCCRVYLIVTICVIIANLCADMLYSYLIRGSRIEKGVITMENAKKQQGSGR